MPPVADRVKTTRRRRFATPQQTVPRQVLLSGRAVPAGDGVIPWRRRLIWPKFHDSFTRVWLPGMVIGVMDPSTSSVLCLKGEIQMNSERNSKVLGIPVANVLLVPTAALGLACVSAVSLAAPPVIEPVDTNVVNTPNVNVANTPSVSVTNGSSDPLPVQSVVRRAPIKCVVATFNATGNVDATCVGPDGSLVTPVPTGYYLAISDVIASSQKAAGMTGQAVVRVSSRNTTGTQFGAGVSMILKPGETQTLHYQTPYEVLPAGRIPTAGVAINFGDVFPVEVYFTGYLVAEEDLGR